MITTTETRHVEDYRGWSIAVASSAPNQWHAFVSAPGCPHGRHLGPWSRRETAIGAARLLVNLEIGE